MYVHIVGVRQRLYMLVPFGLMLGDVVSEVGLYSLVEPFPFSVGL